MSAETKKTVQDINEKYKKIIREAGDDAARIGKADGDLAKKIVRVKENANEVVKHIEERIEK